MLCALKNQNIGRLTYDHRFLQIILALYIPSKVFCNFIGWVESAIGKNSWVTSLSYARDRAPKVLINYAELLTYSQLQFGRVLMVVF